MGHEVSTDLFDMGCFVNARTGEKGPRVMAGDPGVDCTFNGVPLTKVEDIHDGGVVIRILTFGNQVSNLLKRSI